MKHVRVSFDFRLPEHKYPHFIQPTYRNGFKKNTQKLNNSRFCSISKATWIENLNLNGNLKRTIAVDSYKWLFSIKSWFNIAYGSSKHEAMFQWTRPIVNYYLVKSRSIYFVVCGAFFIFIYLTYAWEFYSIHVYFKNHKNYKQIKIKIVICW